MYVCLFMEVGEMKCMQTSDGFHEGEWKFGEGCLWVWTYTIGNASGTYIND